MLTDPLVQAIILSLLPVSELRGGIPYAVAHGINPFVAYGWCVLGNMLVIPLVYFFLHTLHPVFYRRRFYHWLFDKFVERTRRKAEKKVARWGYWGVMLFVAIPLPITGAYTGTLAAWLLQLELKKAVWYLGLGVLIAGVIVSIATFTGIGVLQLFIKEG